MSPKGTIHHVATDASQDCRQPTWSPLVPRLAFVCTTEGARSELHIWDPAEGDTSREILVPVANTGAVQYSAPKWSPAGGNLLFTVTMSSSMGYSATSELWVLWSNEAAAQQLVSQERTIDEPALPQWADENTVFVWDRSLSSSDQPFLYLGRSDYRGGLVELAAIELPSRPLVWSYPSVVRP